MFGAISANVLMDVARAGGAMFQQDLDLECPPWVFVKPDYLTSVAYGFSVITSNGQRSGLVGSQDHPFFAQTRDWLECEGYIHCERSWSNGDRVLKPFYFNNVLKEVGEQFSCGAAMAYGHTATYNGGNPLVQPEVELPEETYSVDTSLTTDMFEGYKPVDWMERF